MIKNFNHEMEYYFGTFEESLPSTVPPDMTYFIVDHHLYYSLKGKYHLQTISYPYVFSTPDKNYIIMYEHYEEITNDQLIEFVYPGKVSSVINHDRQNKGPQGPEGDKGPVGYQGSIGPQGDDGTLIPSTIKGITRTSLEVGDVVRTVLSERNEFVPYTNLTYTYSGEAEKILLSGYNQNGGRINKIAIDHNNNIYIVGFYVDRMFLMPYLLECKDIKDNQGNLLLTEGKKQGFVAKFTPKGVYEWVTQVNTDGTGEIIDICIGNTNTIYICGNFNGTIIFYDRIYERIAHLHTSPYMSGFIAKINSNSSWDWVNRISGHSNHATCDNIFINEHDIIYAFGTTPFPASFMANLQNGTITLNKYNNSNNYEAQLVNNRWKWVRHVNMGDLYYKSIRLHDKETIYSLQLRQMFAINGAYVFIKKRRIINMFTYYTTTIASDEFLKINCMTTDKEGNIYMCGHFKKSITFLYQDGTSEKIETDQLSMFICKLVDGKHVWMLKAMSIGGDLRWIETDSDGNLYVFGRGANKITFVEKDNTEFEKSSVHHVHGFVSKIVDGKWGYINLINSDQTTHPFNISMFILNSYKDICILGHSNNLEDPEELNDIILYKLKRKYNPVGIVSSLESDVTIKPLEGNMVHTNTVSLVQGKLYWIKNNELTPYDGPLTSNYSKRIIGIAIDDKTLLSGPIDYLLAL